jgi:hypothetical protein
MTLPTYPSRSAVPKPTPKPPLPDEDLIEPALPPSEPADEDVGPRGHEEHDDLYVRDEHGGTDDAAAGDLDIGELVSEVAPTSTSDTQDGFLHDDGEPSLFDEAHASLLEDHHDEPDAGHEELHDLLPSSPDDGGAEGMLDGTEGDVREDDLPELDADAEGELELEEMLKQLGFASDGVEPWEVAPAFGFDRPLVAVVSREGSIAAAGEALVVIGKGEIAPRARPLPDPAVACAWLGPRVLFATSRGIQLAEGSGANLAAIPLAGVTALAVAAGRAWALAGVSLHAIDERTSTAEVARTDVAQIASTSSTLYAVSRSGADARLLSLRAQDRDWDELAVTRDLLEHLARGATLVASAAGAVAAIDTAATLLWRPGSGRSTSIPLEDVAAATFCGDGPHAPLLLATESGALTVFEEKRGLAEVGALPFTPRALAWDATRDLAYAVGPGGLVALGPRVTH